LPNLRRGTRLSSFLTGAFWGGILSRLDMRTGEWTFAGGWTIERWKFPVAEVWSGICDPGHPFDANAASFLRAFSAKTPEAEQKLFEQRFRDCSALRPEGLNLHLRSGRETTDKTLGIVKDGFIRRLRVYAASHLTCWGVARTRSRIIGMRRTEVGGREYCSTAGDRLREMQHSARIGQDSVRKRVGCSTSKSAAQSANRPPDIPRGPSGSGQNQLRMAAVRREGARGARICDCRSFSTKTCFARLRGPLRNRLGVRFPIVPASCRCSNAARKSKRFCGMCARNCRRRHARLGQYDEDAEEWGGRQNTGSNRHADVPGAHQPNGVARHPLIRA